MPSQSPFRLAINEIYLRLHVGRHIVFGPGIFQATEQRRAKKKQQGRLLAV